MSTHMNTEQVFLKEPYYLFKLEHDYFFVSDSMLYRVNETAFVILEALQWGASIGTIMDHIAVVYCENGNAVLSDVRGFVALLGGLSAIELRHDISKPYSAYMSQLPYEPPVLVPLKRPVSFRPALTVVGGRPQSISAG